MIRALIVDDEPVARELLRSYLKTEQDLEVIGESGDGLDALASIRKLRPDVVFLDIRMPGLDGFQLLEKLAPAELPAVIFVTAFDDYAVRAFRVHALD